MKKIICLLLLLSYSLGFGNKFQKTLAVDRNLWTLPMNNSKDFDVASKMEMLVFINVLSEIETKNENVLFVETNVKSPNSNGVIAWKKDTKKKILENFKTLQEEALLDVVKLSDLTSYDKLLVVASSFWRNLPTDLKEWYLQTRKFYYNYILDCVRLAAKNPTRTSEIVKLDNSEKTGFELKDKQFLLTFDDGPTAIGGNTDKTIAMLKKEQLSSVFFLSGEPLKNRVLKDKNLINLYGENWIGSHSMIHESHQYLKSWKSQIDENNRLLKRNFGIENKTIYFRPPYGQRTLEMTKYLLANNQPTILWNIDSLDWNYKISANETASRVISLMLLWRKGIILFHDIHPKAISAVPTIKKYFRNSQIIWLQPQKL